MTTNEQASATGPLSAQVIAERCVAQIEFCRVACHFELGQERSPAERLHLIEQLWKRGEPGDVDAIGRLLARFPELGVPSFLRLPGNVRDRAIRLSCTVNDDEIDDALPLLEGMYWLAGQTRCQIRAALLHSTARIAARDRSGRIIAFARAVSDGKCAWIYDVAVAPHARSAHLGSAVINVLLDHPMVREALHVRLSTRDAMAFYRRLGFRNLAEVPRYPWTSTEMIKTSDAALAVLERPNEPEAGVVATDERNDQRSRQAP